MVINSLYNKQKYYIAQIMIHSNHIFQHPVIAPTCTTDLPGRFSFSWINSKVNKCQDLVDLAKLKFLGK